VDGKSTLPPSASPYAPSGKYNRVVPTYEYACTRCGQHVEVFQHISDEPLTACGVCGGKLRKVFHPAGILFKGSGFYSTDSRSKPSSTDGSKTSSEAASSEKSGGAKADGTKSEAAGSKSSGDGGKKESKPSGPKEKSA
jgi:putative FmdB family regulatory protein